MDVLLTFDIEIWCNGWERLDEKFPSAYRRYLYGSSSKGNFGLPRILHTLDRYDLKGIFFVEPMFAGRFGLEHLAKIVDMIKTAGQEVQLHLHTEWTDEIQPPILAAAEGKRQHLQQYTREEQTSLVRYALKTLCAAGASDVSAFRAGSFAANRDTFFALEANGIYQDSSVNATMPVSVPDLRESVDVYRRSDIEGVTEYPISVFVDGLGRERHAQVGACSASEMIQAIEQAQACGWPEFVILAHNFELLRVGSSEPDAIVVDRFERICRYLGHHARDLPTTGFRALGDSQGHHHAAALPRVRLGATLRRYSEQALRRVQDAVPL